MDIPQGRSRALPDGSFLSLLPPMTGQAAFEEELALDCGRLPQLPVGAELEAPIDPSAYTDEFYSFRQMDGDGRPITWPGDKRISVMADPTGSDYASFLDDVDEAVGHLALASGFDLHFDGIILSGMKQVPERQIAIRWEDPHPLMRAIGRIDEVRAIEVSKWRNVGSRSVWAMSNIWLRRQEVHEPPGFVPNGWGVVLLHELAHSLGLGHCSDKGQVMFPTTGGVSQLGWGDRLGLQLLREAAP